MASKSLIEKIESLSPELRAEVERRIDEASPPARPAIPRDAPDPLLERVRARRERLRGEHGLFDTSTIFRELREEGG